MHKFIDTIKNLALPVAMATGTILYLIGRYTPALDEFGNNIEPIVNESLPWFLFLVLYVTFCKVNFHKMRFEIWHVWVIAIQTILTLIPIAIILFLVHEPHSKIFWEATLMCIIGPTATASAVVTAKLGGDLASMTAFTLLSNLVAAIQIPLFLPMIEPHANLTFFQAFLIILYKVLIILILPLLLAWLTRRYLPRLQTWVVSHPDLGFYIWAWSLILVMGTTVKNIFNCGAPLTLLLMIALSALVVCLIQFKVGKLIGKHNNGHITAEQALGQKNTSFEIWVAFTYVNPASSVGPGCYILWQNLVNSWELWRDRKIKTRQEAILDFFNET